MFVKKRHTEEDIKGLILQPHYQACYDAHRGTSQVPGERGFQYVISYSKTLEEDIVKIKEAGGDVEKFKAKWVSLFLAWMHAKGRVISVLVTGASNFPTKRNQKANNSESNRSDEFHGYTERVLKAIASRKRREAKAATTPLIEATKRYEYEKSMLDVMKAVNKVLRLKITDLEKQGQIRLLVNKTNITDDNLLLGYDTVKGFPGYKLRNCRSRMKSWEAKMNKYKKLESMENTEFMIGDVRVVNNFEENRLQLFFPDIPCKEVRAALKARNAFRWAGSKGCWQGYLTDNGIWKFKEFVLPVLKEHYS